MLYGLYGFWGFGGLLTVAFWFSSIWIYHDAKEWRRKGVPVRPGLVAGTLLLAFLGANIFESFVVRAWTYQLYYSVGRGYAPGYLLSFLPLLLPAALFCAYWFLRSTRYAKIAEAGNPPLPNAPRWTKWFFIVIFFLPIMFPLVLIFLLFSAFHAFPF